MSQEKIYVGQGKEFGQYGNIGVSICIEDATPHFKKGKNGKTYLNIVIAKRKTKGQYGDTHSVTINDWTPDGSKKSAPRQEVEADKIEDYDDIGQDISDEINPEDIPF